VRERERERERERDRRRGRTRDGGVVLLEVGLDLTAARFDPKVGIVGFVAVDLLQF